MFQRSPNVSILAEDPSVYACFTRFSKDSGEQMFLRVRETNFIVDIVFYRRLWIKDALNDDVNDLAYLLTWKKDQTRLEIIFKSKRISF